jgi:hypothetical protein
MSSKNRLQSERPGVFRPTVSRGTDGAVPEVKFLSRQDLESGISFSDYFIYDQESGFIKSTQQVPVDYSLFENHTFFNSAQTNVNVAFNNIINKYPFDGTRRDYEKYLNGLTGFEKHVLDQFPRNVGFVVFSGSAGPANTDGNNIEVKDFSGAEFLGFSSDKSGKSVLSLNQESYTVESKLFLPPIENGNEIICQKLSGSNGYTLAVSSSTSTASASVVFAIRSGSSSLVTSASLLKNQFNHVAIVYDRNNEDGRLNFYVDADLVASSSKTSEFGEIDFRTSSLFLGSGSTHSGILDGDLDFIPDQTLSGALDEFRVFREARTKDQIKQNKERNIFASNALRLYFKFNEPTGSIGDNSIVLDSSGKSLHSKITNYDIYNRTTSSYSASLEREDLKLNPILFPKFGDVISLNENLLSTASNYDKSNPNLITRLVPEHYFDEGKNFFAMNSVDGELMLPYTGSSIPGSGELGSSQVLTAVLFTWAKFFDELKIITDQFSNLLEPSYKESDGMSDAFIKFLSNHYGLEPPPIFTDSNANQFYHGADVTDSYVNIDQSLQSIRNQILRRFLVNINDISTSKGTISSVKSSLRALGLDPDIIVKIKEYGGPKKFELSDMRVDRAVIQPLLDFSGSTNNQDLGSLTPQGFAATAPNLLTAFLSGSRKEVGFPEQNGTMLNPRTAEGGFHGVSNSGKDGLFTSGSWTYEGIYQFLASGSLILSQSAARIHVTGNTAPSTVHGVTANLVVMSGSVSGSSPAVKLFVRASTGSFSATAKPPLELTLTGVNVMDGDKWNISFGRVRNDDPIQLTLSSSYFLRCAKSEAGRIFEIHTTSSFYKEDATGSLGIVYQNTGTMNTSGAFIVIGSQSVNRATNFYLNDSGITDQARITYFDGKVGQIRFWSKALEVDEWSEHVRNPNSAGVKKPSENFNFEKTHTGSFQRLRLDVSMDQPVSASDSSGQIILTDFTQNSLFATGSGFMASKTLFKYDKVLFTSLPPAFDDLENSNKIRPRSFVSASNITEYNASPAPFHEIPPNELPQDDARFSIDFSVAGALNDDIITMFATLDEIDDAIGRPNLQFSPDYPDFQNLRDVYFNKLEKKVTFKQFFEFFKWFDTSVGTMIEQLVPKKTNFLGVNFVIEPHSLERSKLQYQYQGQYVGEEFRTNLKGEIRLQQIAGRATKF